MKKFFYSSAFFMFLFLYQLNAQAFKLEYDSVSVDGPGDSYELVAYNKVVNLTDNALNLRWERDIKELTQNWSIQVCDINLCYGSAVNSADFNLPARDTGNIDVHFVNDGKQGISDVDIVIYPVGGSSLEGIVSTFTASTWATSAPQEGGRSRFNFYPNPVRDFININFPDKGNHKIEIFNMLGNKVAEFDFANQSSARIPFMEHPKGMYLLTYRPESGRIITRTFSKE